MVEVDGFTGAGQGVSTDIIDAAARAYVRALSVAVARSQAERRDRAARDRRGLSRFMDCLPVVPAGRAVVGLSPSGEEVGDRDLPAGHRVAEVERRRRCGTGHRRRVGTRSPSAYAGRARAPRSHRVEPVQRLRAHIGTAVFGRDHLDREIRRAPGQNPSVVPTASARACATNAASGARTVSGSRQDEPRLGAERQAEAGRAHMVAQQPARGGGDASHARSRRRTSPAAVPR